MQWFEVIFRVNSKFFQSRRKVDNILWTKPKWDKFKPNTLKFEKANEAGVFILQYLVRQYRYVVQLLFRFSL